MTLPVASRVAQSAPIVAQPPRMLLESLVEIPEPVKLMLPPLFVNTAVTPGLSVTGPAKFNGPEPATVAMLCFPGESVSGSLSVCGLADALVMPPPAVVPAPASVPFVSTRELPYSVKPAAPELKMMLLKTVPAPKSFVVEVFTVPPKKSRSAGFGSVLLSQFGGVSQLASGAASPSQILLAAWMGAKFEESSTPRRAQRILRHAAQKQ